MDSSAILAVLFREPEAAAFKLAIIADQQCVMSAADLLETAMVLRSRRGREGVATLMVLVNDLKIEMIAFHEAQAEVALNAFDRFGKGLHPKARLNLCDCAA